MIIGVCGATNSGKSTFIEALAQKLDAEVVSVGKILRAKYPPEYFQGQCNPAATAQEALSLMSEAIEKTTRKHVILDGQPRGLDQAQWLSKYRDIFIVHIWVPPEEREARARVRDTGAALELSLSRVKNDATVMFDVMAYCSLHFLNCTLDGTDTTDEQVNKFLFLADL